MKKNHDKFDKIVLTMSVYFVIGKHKYVDTVKLCLKSKRFLK